jgi:hypothetical protein
MKAKKLTRNGFLGVFHLIYFASKITNQFEAYRWLKALNNGIGEG